MQRPSTYLRTRAAGSAALTDPRSGEEEERAAVPISHCAGRVPVSASPSLSSALLGLDTVFACGLEGRGEKVCGVLVLLADRPLIPREIIARHGNCRGKSRQLLRGRGWKVKVRGGQAAAAFLKRLVCRLGERVDCSASSNLRQRPLVPGLARAACTRAPRPQKVRKADLPALRPAVPCEPTAVAVVGPRRCFRSLRPAV